MNNDYSYIEVDFDPFAEGEIEKTALAIEPQQEIWASCLIGGEDANRSYNESVSLLLTGAFQRPAMERALQGIIDRHEALRSTFSTDGKQICIYTFKKLDIVYEDLSGRSPDDRAAFLASFSQKDMLTTFDLHNGPLFRVALFRLSEEEHEVRLTAHHIVCDGWSFGIVLEDLGALYSAYAKGETPVLEPTMDFSQYAAANLAFTGSKEYQATEQYWIDQYRDNVPELTIPTDYPRPVRRTYKSRRDDFTLSPELVAAIKKTGSKTGSSLVSTLMVAFEVYLHRISGQQDIVLGLPTAGQSATGNLSLVGHCVNLLPLRSSPKGDMPFIDYLRERRKKIMDDYDHQQFTFGSLLKKLNVARDSSRVPLVPIVFNIDAGMDSNVSFYQLRHRLSSNPREYENFEIFLNATGSQQSLILEWSYNTQLFTPATIRFMMDGLESLLKNLTEAPGTPIRSLSIGSQNLLSQLAEWNATHSVYAKDKPVPLLVGEIAHRFPDKTAIRSGERQLSYKELNELSNGLAGYFIQQGIRPGDIIGLAIDRSPEMIATLLAIMKAGAAYVPLDPQYPKDRIEFMLADSTAKILFTSRKYKGQFATSARELLAEDVWPLIKTGSYQYPAVTVNGSDLAYVLYTSGSTGKPKGVQIEHHSLANLLLSMQKAPGLTATDILLAVTTISFDISGLEMYLPLISGATIVLADPETSRDGRLLLRLIEDKKISVMQATPSTWRMLLDAGWSKPFPLKVLCGGEAFPKDLCERLLEKCQSVWNVYGPTETTIWSSVKQLSDKDPIITVGHPIDNTQFYILDGYNNLLPPGTPGEICIAGDGVARGYLNRQELTNEKFVNDPYTPSPGAKMYRTGDLGKFLGNGEILCLGRIDNQVKVRGYRIEPGEIEHALTRLHGIREAVVIAREDQPGNQRLVAYIVPDQLEIVPIERAKESSEAGKIIAIPNHQLQTWKDILRESLPEYMVPAEFVLLERLPATSNGKIDRNRLPKPASQSQDGNAFITPRTPEEQLVFTIWSEQLNIPEISINSNFFELGGHSLVAVKVMLALEQQTGRRLPLAAIFENSTIEKLAHMITVEEDKIKWDSLVPIKTSGSKMPIYMVHGAGLNVLTFSSLGKYMDEDQPVYAMQALGLNGKTELLYTIEEIAAKYNAEILANDPDGPYALAGYSLGGFIAFEMARQLMKMGKEVKMLGILDTHAGNRDSSERKTKKAYKKVIRQFRKLAFFSKLFVTHPRRTFTYQSEILTRKIRKIFVSKYKVDKDFFTYEKEVNRSYDIAYDRYFMDAIDLKVDLFRVKQRIYYIDDPTYMEWTKYTTRGVEVHDVPGDHKTFLFPPNDKEFARVLQTCLDEHTKEKVRFHGAVGTQTPVLKAV